jgi:hypothetical protein
MIGDTFQISSKVGFNMIQQTLRNTKINHLLENRLAKVGMMEALG